VGKLPVNPMGTRSIKNCVILTGLDPDGVHNIETGTGEDVVVPTLSAAAGHSWARVSGRVQAELSFCPAFSGMSHAWVDRIPSWVLDFTKRWRHKIQRNAGEQKQGLQDGRRRAADREPCICS
jgi:hypothetical protein